MKLWRRGGMGLLGGRWRRARETGASLPYYPFWRSFTGLGVALLIATMTPAVAAAEPLVIAFGDSLTSGYGLHWRDSFPRRLEAWLEAAGVPARVVNAGLSGETTAGARTRLNWTLAEEPDLVIVQFGGNDALRGIDPAVTRDNLDAILGQLKARGIKILLAGMLAPRNLDNAYVHAFDSLFPVLAHEHAATLYPFFLDGVATNPALNQADGIHPNAAGVTVIVERIGPVVKRLIADD